MQTPYMNLTLPDVSQTAGPLYATDVNDAFESVDSHNHSSGQGVPVPTAGININADLSFNSFNANSLRSTQLTNQGSPLALATDICCVYASGGNLYYNNSTGQQVQLTSGAGLNAASVGGFGGDYGTSTASAFYTSASTLFSFTSAANTYANMAFGAFTVYATGASPKGVTINAPAGLGANYSLTLPTGLPASTKLLTCDTAGNLGFQYNYIAPTVQKFTATGTTTGYLFNISTSTTCSIGDTYTNNSKTFTVQAALSAQSGIVLWCTGTGAPTSSGTLTRTSGSGTLSVTFTANTTYSTYTASSSNPLPLFIKVKAVGPGGGGGAVDGTVSGTTPSFGTYFGFNIVKANPGAGGQGNLANSSLYALGGTGGTASVTGYTGISISGSAGNNSGATNSDIPAGTGGAAVFGGAGAAGGGHFGAGGNAATNSGAGGGGASSSGVNGGAAGGGAGGYVEVILPGAASYPLVVSGGGAGGSGANANGGNGAAGIIIVEEHYQ